MRRCCRKAACGSKSSGYSTWDFTTAWRLDRLEQNTYDTVATLYSQHPTSPVTLEVMVESDKLPPGTYSLRVRKQSSDEESLDFSFVKF